MKSLLAQLANDPVLRTLNAAPPRPSELPEIYRIALDQVGKNVATYEVVKAVYDQNRASFVVLYGGGPGRGDATEIDGLLTVLYVSPAGESAIVDGSFTPWVVRAEWLCAPNEDPAAIYAWAIAGRTRVGRIRLARIAQHLSYDLFGGYTQYGYAATGAGQALMEKLEFIDAVPLLPSIRQGTYVRWGRSHLQIRPKSSTRPGPNITRQ